MFRGHLIHSISTKVNFLEIWKYSSNEKPQKVIISIRNKGMLTFKWAQMTCSDKFGFQESRTKLSTCYPFMLKHVSA